MALTQNQQIVHQMYIAYYQRPADPEGLAYWVDQIETAGGWPNVAAAFGAPENAEYTALYGGKTRAEIVADLYQSAFGRAAVQSEIDFWADSDFADTSLGFAIISGAQNDDLATVTNKVAFAEEIVALTVTNAGYAQIADVKAVLTAIDANSDVSASAVKSAIEANTVGDTFTLTEALAADELPAEYNLSDDVFAAGEVDVATAASTFAQVTAIVEGAQNDAAAADLFTYALADTLASLEAADAAVLAGAGSYSLTNADTALGNVTEAGAALIEGAENTADYTFGLAGETFSLTADADTTTGTANNDTIDGVVSALTADNTLNPTDVIDGGEGTDTANVVLNTNFAGFSSAGSLKNVETVNLSTSSSIARTFDASGITGVESYNIDASTAAVSQLTDLAATVAVNLSNQASGTFSTAFATGAAELTGTADVMALGLTNVGVVEDPATTVVEEKTVAITLNDIETANVNATGANVVSFGGTDLKTLNVTGDGSIKISAVPTSLTVFDASAVAGNVDADLTATTSTLTTVATGSGDDTLTFNTADAAANATLSGGAGADTLELSSAGGTVQYGLTGFETVALGTVGAAVTFSGANTADIAKVTTQSGVTAAVSHVNMGAGALTIEAKGATVDAGDISTDGTGALTVDYSADAASVAAKTAQNGLADFTAANASSLTVNVGEYTDTSGSDITAAKATSVILNVASGKSSASTPVEVTEFDGTITAAAATSVVVNAEGQLGANALITAAAAIAVSITNGASAGNLDVAAVAAQNLNVSTGNTLDLSGSTFSGVQSATVATSKGLVTLDALADIAALTLTGAGTTAGSESAVTVGALGGANDYDMTITANGLKGGFSAAGTINVNVGQGITANVGGVTGNVTLGVIGGVTEGNNVTINAAGTGGIVTVGAINSTGAGAINVTSSAVGTSSFGAMNADTTGNVTANFDGSIGGVTINAFTGKTVNVDASDTIDGVTGPYTVTALDSATVAVSSLEASTVGITAATGSTALTAAVTGGIDVDTVTVTGVDAQTSIIVTGDLGLGTDVLNVDGSNQTTNAQTISIAGVTNYDAATITGSAQIDTITGGAGADTITSGAGADVFVFATGDTGITLATADTITDFATTVDNIDTQALNASVVANGSNYADFTAFVTAADASFTGGGNIDAFVAWNAAGSGNAYVAVDENGDGAFNTGDSLVILTGIGLANEIAVGDIA